MDYFEVVVDGIGCVYEQGWSVGRIQGSNNFLGYNCIFFNICNNEVFF